MWPCLFAAAAAVSLAAPAAGQVYVPIPVTGYNQDVIADAGSTAPASTSVNFDVPVPGDVGYVPFEQGYNSANPTQGIPANGLIVTSASRSYQLGPISGNNSLQLYGPDSGTLTFVAPGRFSALSMLLASGDGKQPSDGGSPGTLSIGWSNGGVTTLGYITYDWFLLSGTPAPGIGVAVSSLGRAVRASNGPIDPTTGTNPVFFYEDFDLTSDPNFQAGALVTNVTVGRDSLSVATDILALSGVAAPVPEPSTLLLTAAAGLAGILARRRKRASTPRPKVATAFSKLSIAAHGLA